MNDAEMKAVVALGIDDQHNWLISGFARLPQRWGWARAGNIKLMNNMALASKGVWIVLCAYGTLRQDNSLEHKRRPTVGGSAPLKVCYYSPQSYFVLISMKLVQWGCIIWCAHLETLQSSSGTCAPSIALEMYFRSKRHMVEGTSLDAFSGIKTR